MTGVLGVVALRARAVRIHSQSLLYGPRLSLGSTVVIPLVAGQLARYSIWHRIERYNIPFSTLSSIVLLMIIYTAFCDTFSSNFDVGRSDLLGIIAVDAW